MQTYASHIERAQVAIDEFNKLAPMLTSFARAFTGNPLIKVVPQMGGTMTDGRFIYVEPPLGLADNISHNKDLCNRHDGAMRAMCEACGLRETVLVRTFHEIAHNWAGSFEEVPDTDKARAVTSAAKEMGIAVPQHVLDQIRQATLDGAKISYDGIARTISPFLDALHNALEDARVNKKIGDARPGFERMRQGDEYESMYEGRRRLDPETGEERLMMFGDRSLDLQAAIGLYRKASGFELPPSAHADVVTALADERLDEICASAAASKTVRGSYDGAVRALVVLQEYGLMGGEKKQEEELPQPPGMPSEEESDSNGEPEEGNDGGEQSDRGDSGSSEADAEGDDTEADDDSDDTGDGDSAGPEGAQGGADQDNEDSDAADASEGNGESGESAGDESGDAGGGADSDDSPSESDDEADSEGSDAADAVSESGSDQDGSDGTGSTESGDAEGGSEDAGDVNAGDQGGSEASNEDGGEESADDAAGGQPGSDEGSDGEAGDQADASGDGSEGSQDGTGGGDEDEGPSSSDQATGGSDAGEPGEQGDPAEGGEPSGDGQQGGPEGDSADDASSDGSEVGTGSDVAGPGCGGERDDSHESATSDSAERADGEADDLGDGDGGRGHQGEELDDPLGEGDQEDHAGDTEGGRQSLEGAATQHGSHAIGGTTDGATETDVDVVESDENELSDDDGTGDPIDAGEFNSDWVPTTHDPLMRDDGRPVEILTAEEVAEEMEDFFGHNQEGVNAHEAREAVQALVHVMNAGIFFDMIPRNVVGARIHKYDKHVVQTWVDSAGRTQSRDWAGGWTHEFTKARGYRPWQVGVEGNFRVPEKILGAALQRARIAFADNARTRELRNLKSGKVNGRVLGRRAPVKDPRLFAKKFRPGRRNYFVILGGDISYSTLGTPLVLIKRAIMAQAEVLSRLGIQFEVIMHSADTSRVSYVGGGVEGYEVDLYLVKEAGEPWNDAARKRLEKIGPDSNNLDGHTIQLYRKRLDARTETDRILMYYTDGRMPALNAAEEAEVLKRELKIFDRNGYKLLCVGVNTSSPEDWGLSTVRVDEDKDLINVIKHLEKALI